MTVRPALLPFFHFQATVSSTYSGRAGFERTDYYTDIDSKGETVPRSKKSTDWYRREGSVPNGHYVPQTERVAEGGMHFGMQVYASYDYRRAYLRNLQLGSEHLSLAQPISQVIALIFFCTFVFIVLHLSRGLSKCEHPPLLQYRGRFYVAGLRSRTYQREDFGGGEREGR